MQIIEKIKNNKKIRNFILIVLFILLIIFTILSLTIGNKNITTEDSSITNYISNLESKLSKELSKVEGAGNVSVVLTLESGMETVLAMETTTTNNNGIITTEEKPVYINGKTITIKELYPKISGVLIVLEGQKNITVEYRIQQATMSLLNIKSSQIEILTGK